MKLINYLHNNNKSYGILKADGVIDLKIRIGNTYPTIKSLLAADALSVAAEYQHNATDLALDEIVYLPVIDDPLKIICAGMNYAEKRLEFDESDPAPTLFVRFADSQIGHNNDILKPKISAEFDYEGELAVVIGKTCSHVSAAEALDYVAGYSCYMDGSVRDWQHSWFTAGKNWPATGAFGPCLTTRDEITDPQTLNLRTLLNGRVVQDDNTANMVHKVADLIAYISTFTELSAGDVILTGSPGGVGKKRVPPLFLQPGDVIEVEIEHIGRLTNTISEAKQVNAEKVSA
ncbi:fumarylacetoacetate hydrolase family protein [Rouxiella sp. Mn2063]|uniref:fumarylacetoacetate hydrolase family protein n=1 Tax=Rouxiella sp. Mn2063 TaxID=3395262 RepID=UPI003BE33585